MNSFAHSDGNRVLGDNLQVDTTIKSPTLTSEQTVK